ncbi:hypothetical protein GCM10011369_05570 [Neiella marina]|uniref:Uncharacterized protein n=2 Tax=Neiella marina TaxID=508461 RepID=A0A8J2U2F7_9GAMM|nr:hypothetical protein GCM10011369_05570 [Neiella marina]
MGKSYSFPYEKDADISQSRTENDVKTGELDFMWAMTSERLEKEFEPVYFPVFRGILGMRLSIVKANQKDILSSVENLNDLKRFVPGQGKTWADTMILESNGLHVTKSHKYPNLFFMLEGERFDYFPRGLFEPWAEVDKYPQLNLTVDPHILIRYTAPMYFFTRKGNEELAQALFKELESMALSGEYKSLFYADDEVKQGIEKSNLKDRTMIQLENPYLTEKTPLERTEFWYQLGEVPH